MRPRYLEIEGLQSFIEKQAVNFDELSETGLFGIFGPTGSGKSTVLDAITLALYGEVNRALSGTQGIINTSASSVKVLFDFDLKKEGKYKSYRVERLYQRKKGTENSCEAKVARLIELSEAGDTPVADKPREVTSRVEELLGLRHDDFMRAVVLPQNKFQEFLMLDKYKKREMLERIFYMEEYGKQLTDKVSARLAAVKDKLLLMQGELLALGDSSDEALKTVSEDLKNSQQRSRKALEEFKLAETGYNNAKDLWQLVSDLGVIENMEREHLCAADAVNEKVNLLDRALKAKSLEDITGRYENTARSLDGVVSRLQPLEVLLAGLETELAETKLARETATVKSNEEKKELIERRMYLNQALEVKQEIAAVSRDIEALRNEYIKLRDEIAASEKKIAEKQNTIEQLNSDMQAKKRQITECSIPAGYREQVQEAAKLEESLAADERNLATERLHLKELSEVVESLKNNIKTAEAEMGQARAEAAAIAEQQAAHELKKPGDRETAAVNVEKYHALRGSAAMLALKGNELASVVQKTGQLENTVQKLKEDLAGYIEGRDKLYEKKSVLNSKIAEFRRILQMNAAYMLSVGLNEGDPCPVCGSLHHPQPASGNADRELAETEKEIREAEAAMEKLQAEIIDAESRFTATNEQIRQNEKLLNQMNNDCEAGKTGFMELSNALSRELAGYYGGQEAYAEAVAALEGPESGMKILDTVLERIGEINACTIEAINDWYTKSEQLKSKLIDAGNIISEYKVSIGSLQAEQKVNLENLSKSQNLLDTLAVAFNEKSSSYKMLAEKLGISSAVRESASLLEKDVIVEKLLKESEQLQAKVTGETAALDKLKEERSSISERLAASVNDGKHLKDQKELKEARLLELAGESDIGAGIKAVDDRTLEIGKNEKLLAEKVELLELRVKTLTEQKNTMEGQKNTFAASLEEMKITFELLLKQKGFYDLAEAKKYMISKDLVAALDEEVKKYRQTESNLKAQKELLLKKLDGKSITSDEWEQRQLEYDTKLVEKDESAASYEVVRNIFNTIRQKNRRWSELNTEVKKAEHVNSQLEQIKSLLKGNSFIEYVAEERLRYIAREASGTLGVMTRFRYALELDSDNGFVIRDNASGGVHRPVTSLSGGEIFLTSLSLALALSSQIHLKGQSPLEFFFLDEGFGTLDNNLLDQVIDSLERISTKERMIGLISHVPELKNRITRRLVVEPPKQEGGGSHVRIEKA